MPAKDMPATMSAAKVLLLRGRRLIAVRDNARRSLRLNMFVHQEMGGAIANDVSRARRSREFAPAEGMSLALTGSGRVTVRQSDCFQVVTIVTKG
jgi:hypothetical protein